MQRSKSPARVSQVEHGDGSKLKSNKKSARLKCILHLPHVPLRCCASSFSHAMCVLVHRCRRIPLPACSRKRYYRSIHPIPIQSAYRQKDDRRWRRRRRERKKKVETWNTRMIQVINSQFLPIVSHLKPIRTCSPVAAHSDGSSRMCTIQSSPRCRRGRSNVSLLHLWWHKWKLFRDNLQRQGRRPKLVRHRCQNDQQQQMSSCHIPGSL